MAANFEEPPGVSVVAQSRSGQIRCFKGVAEAVVLVRVGAPISIDLRGCEMNRTVVTSAKDGHRVVFILANLDNGFRRNMVAVAHRMKSRHAS